MHSKTKTDGAVTYRFDHSIATQLQSMFEAIVRSVPERNLRRGFELPVPIAVDGKNLTILFRTTDADTHGASQPSGPSLTERQMRLVTQTIHEKIGEQVPLRMLSSIAGLSPSYFCRAFRATAGFSPHAYVLRARLQHAMTLMIESDERLSDIAVAAGFSDQAHLSRVFRRFIGTKPMHWRRLNRL